MSQLVEATLVYAGAWTVGLGTMGFISYKIVTSKKVKAILEEQAK